MAAGSIHNPLRKGMRARELGLKREGAGARGARSRLIKNERMTLCPEVRSRCLKGRSEMSFSRNKGFRSRHRGQSNVRLLGRRRDLAILIQYSKRSMKGGKGRGKKQLPFFPGKKGDPSFLCFHLSLHLLLLFFFFSTTSFDLKDGNRDRD